ncbi:hypothetical protein [Fundidesulfovibrio butyratiphilus]
MRIQGTIIEEHEDGPFAVFVVTEEIMNDPAKRQAKLDALEPFFPEVPLVLLAPDAAGQPVFHGPQELVDTISDRPFFGFLWREYTLE